MGDQNKQIFILLTEPLFRKSLEMVCHSLGTLRSSSDAEDAWLSLASNRYDLLLIQWDSIAPSGPLDFQKLCLLQPHGVKVVLFQTSDLSSVISAMKMGFDDVIWTQMEHSALTRKIKASLSGNRRKGRGYTHLSPMVETIAKQSFDKKDTLSKARKSFYRVFIKMLLDQTRMTCHQLAALLNVSPRTLQRYISFSMGPKDSGKSKNR